MLAEQMSWCWLHHGSCDQAFLCKLHWIGSSRKLIEMTRYLQVQNSLLLSAFPRESKQAEVRTPPRPHSWLERSLTHIICQIVSGK
jgi:hypothetical protein